MKYLLGGIVTILVMDVLYEVWGWWIVGIVGWIILCGIYLMFFIGARRPSIDEWELCDYGHWRVVGKACQHCVTGRFMRKG